MLEEMIVSLIENRKKYLGAVIDLLQLFFWWNMV